MQQARRSNADNRLQEDTVVEYALHRSLSPALVAEYRLLLPNKKLLENKLRELTEIAEDEKDENIILIGGK